MEPYSCHGLKTYSYVLEIAYCSNEDEWFHYAKGHVYDKNEKGARNQVYDKCQISSLDGMMWRVELEEKK